MALDAPSQQVEVWGRLRALLPQGLALPTPAWEARHRFILYTVAFHAIVLPWFGLWRGWGMPYALGEGAIIGALGALAMGRRLSRRFRSAMAALALVTSSAVLVQFSGGYIEAHFHYFIIVALVALYQDYVPFLLAIGYVAVDHGLIGSIAPQWVYNHPNGIAEPWTWAAIHAAAILGECMALLAFWAGAEQARARSDLVLESAGEGVLGLDKEGRVTFVNAAASRLFNESKERLLKTNVKALLPHIGNESFGETRIAVDSGTVVLEWNLTPTIQNGATIGSVLVLRDVSSRRDLEQDLQSRTRQQAAVARLGQVALDTRSLDRLFNEAVRAVATTLRTDLCKILELSMDGRALLLRAGIGWNEGLLGVATVGSDLDSQAGYTLQSPQPIIVADLRTEQRFRGPALLRDHGVVSGLSVVIPSSSRQWGVLGAHTKESRSFNKDDVSFMLAVAHVLGGAIERSTVEHSLETRNHQQAIIAKLGQEALTGRALGDFLQLLPAEITKAIEVDYCKILAYDEGAKEFFLAHGAGWKPGLVGTLRFPADPHSQAGYALEHDGPVIVLDVLTENRFTGPSLLHDHGIVSGMSVLVKGKDRPFGVIGAHTKARRRFTNDDINFLQTVANLAATAIERHRVEDELREHRLNLERMVERRTAQLTQANREMEAFSYTVSHDLRSPLRSMNGFSQILLAKYGKRMPPEAQDLLDKLSDGAVQMGRLIESILSLSRLSRAEMKREAINLTALASSILTDFSARNPERKVEFSVEPGLTAHADAGLMRIAFENLLSNAWKFTSHADPARIRVARVHTRDGPAFLVEDNGAGFDMANASELFQAFHRLHQPDEFEGTGIGLATVHRIIQRHGGQIWVEAEPGRGARFYFTLNADPKQPTASQFSLASNSTEPYNTATVPNLLTNHVQMAPDGHERRLA